MERARKIALFLRAVDNEYQELQRSDFLSRADLHGYASVIFDAGNDPTIQLLQVDSVLRSPEGFAAMLAQPVQESRLEPAVAEAARRGIAWVTLNRFSAYVRELRTAHTKAPIFCVEPDQERIGHIQAQQFLTLLGKGGTVVYITGPGGTSSARRRLSSVEIALAGAPIRLCVEGGDWTSESGFEATRLWLMRNPEEGDRLIVGAQNDAMALGARKALVEQAGIRKRPELAEVRVTGCDGLPRGGQRWVASGTLTATIVMPTTTAVAVDQLASAWASGNARTLDVVLGVQSFPDLEVLARTERSRDLNRPGSSSAALPGRMPRRKTDRRA